MSKNLKGKSYNQVMNEWAAQRSFLRRAGSSLFSPSIGVTGTARLWGWFWRLLLLTGLPLLAYMGILRFHGKSAGFTRQLAAETKRFLDADSVEFKRSRWDMNGELRAELIKIKGSPRNIFSSVEISNLSTWITVPGIFRPQWHLKSVDAVRATVALRSGGPGAALTTANSEYPALLTAGWGINPDGSKLTVDRYQCDKLNLSWGTTPSTSGGLADSAVAVERTENGWGFVAAGGTFSQCWLDQVRLTEARIQIGTDKAVIEKGDFTVPGGGSGSLTGSITLGETPEINASIKLENIPFHDYLPELLHPFVKVVCHGSIALTGSTNRSTGILMDTRLTVQSGNVSGIPIFRALELTTGETSLAQPELSGGHIHFTSQGSQEAGGQVIEADDVFLDCGTRMKISLTLRHERKQVLAANIQTAKTTGDSVAVSTGGTLRIGLPPETAARLKPAIRQEFLTREEQGYQWMDIPFRMEEGNFTKAAADRMIALHYGGK